MKDMIRFTLGSIALLTAVGAGAVQQDITVTADIDSTVSLTKTDGTALPDSVKLVYRAGKGLDPYKENVKLWSNAPDTNILISLIGNPQLTDQNGNNPIPLAVSINGSALSPTATTLTYANVFTNGITNGSQALPLVISQKTEEPVSVTGSYSGVVSIVLTQATSTTSP